MNNTLLPVNDEFVEFVAKIIAEGRMRRDADAVLLREYGKGIDDVEEFDSSFRRVFEQVWAGTSAHDEWQKSLYRDDAKSVILAINLKLLTTL